jgi:hypothetical protein
MQREIRYGDDDYDTLYDEWVEEGSGASFEYLNETEESKGLWYVIERNTSRPIFLRRAQAGLTESGNDKPVEWRPTSGYEVEMPEMGLEITLGPGGPGDLKIGMKDFPNATV